MGRARPQTSAAPVPARSFLRCDCIKSHEAIYRRARHTRINCIPRATATRLQDEDERRCRPARSRNLQPPLHKTPRRGREEVPAGPLPESPTTTALRTPRSRCFPLLSPSPPPYWRESSHSLVSNRQPQLWGRRRRSSPTASSWCRSRARARAWPPGRSTCSSPSPCDSATTRPSRSTGYQATLPPSSTRLRRHLTSPSADTSRY